MPTSQKPRKRGGTRVPKAELIARLRLQPPVCNCEFHTTVKRLLQLRGGNWNAWPARQAEPAIEVEDFTERSWQWTEFQNKHK